MTAWEKMKNSKKFHSVLLGFLLLVIYYQIFSAGFLPWDDDYNISINPYFLQSQ